MSVSHSMDNTMTCVISWRVSRSFQTEGTSSLGCHGRPYEAGDNCSFLPLIDSTFSAL
jgi:hypothetical protein